MHSSYASVLGVVFFAIHALGAVTNGCNTFLTGGSSPSQFQYYRFYDFRNMFSASTGYSNLPASKVTTDATWRTDWTVWASQKRTSAAIKVAMQFAPSTISIANSTDGASDYSTYLNMTTSKLNSTAQVGAELDYKQNNLFHLSYRVKARIVGSAGACASMFTYYNDTTESDIEILTGEPTDSVHLTNQPGSSAGGTKNFTLPAGSSWNNWNVYRLDWISGNNTAWYLNGKLLTISTVNVPQFPSTVIMNLWSNGASWSGNMPVGNSAALQVQWVELAFNTSAVYTYPTTQTTCSLD